MTMSSFNSLSLDPPLVLFSIDRRAASLPQWQAAAGYAVHVLAESQEALSNRFARPRSNKWEGVPWTAGHAGAPLLAGAACVFECDPFAQHDGGDHVLFLARVIRFSAHPDRRPLVFHQGRYSTLHKTDHAAALWPLDIHY
jgi:flavin reductase (DIM6/NTAB) family NADH-FMN oxidoreductase RutF